MNSKWTSMTAAKLGESIKSGLISSIDLTEAFIEAFSHDDKSSRIYSTLTLERAREEAILADQRAKDGSRHGPLDGVPISWKDNFHIEGYATEAGSALLKGKIADHDSPIVTRVSGEGLVCLGKTHMSELAFSGLGLNPITATPPNKNDPNGAPGGSSSGAGASVAFGMAAAAVGSDTGGSVRIPAAWNDLAGLQTTPGRISMVDTLPLCSRFDTVGPIGRTVEDCALMLGAFEGNAGPKLSDSTLSGVRLAVLDEVSLHEMREVPSRAYEQALIKLTRAGARVERVSFPCLLDAIGLAGPLFTAEAWGIWKDVIETAPEKMFPRILERFRGASGITAADYIGGWRKLDLIRAKWRKTISQFDAIVMPTTPILPPNIERLISDDDYYVSENMLALRYTRISNLIDSCALTVPTAEPSCGLMFVGAPMNDEQILRIGHAAEMLIR